MDVKCRTSDMDEQFLKGLYNSKVGGCEVRGDCDEVTGPDDKNKKNGKGKDDPDGDDSDGDDPSGDDVPTPEEGIVDLDSLLDLIEEIMETVSDENESTRVDVEITIIDEVGN